MLERTLVFIKPDGVKRKLVGRILARFEEKGFDITASKTMMMDLELAKKHYVEHVERPYFKALSDFITSGPIMAFVLEGERVVEIVRLMMGPTDGGLAPLGTIRGDFALSRQENLIHASDSIESSAREIPLFFPELG
jgi:nucleoside-diphosphate kinase